MSRTFALPTTYTRPGSTSHYHNASNKNDKTKVIDKSILNILYLSHIFRDIIEHIISYLWIDLFLHSKDSFSFRTFGLYSFSRLLY